LDEVGPSAHCCGAVHRRFEPASNHSTSTRVEVEETSVIVTVNPANIYPTLTGIGSPSTPHDVARNFFTLDQQGAYEPQPYGALNAASI